MAPVVWVGDGWMNGLLKVRRDKYQQGSIRRVKRANGFAWEFRYYVEQNGKRVLRSQYFDGSLYRTEKAVRQ
jgi:hypothetical protein